MKHSTPIVLLTSYLFLASNTSFLFAKEISIDTSFEEDKINCNLFSEKYPIIQKHLAAKMKTSRYQRYIKFFDHTKFTKLDSKLKNLNNRINSTHYNHTETQKLEERRAKVLAKFLRQKKANDYIRSLDDLNLSVIKKYKNCKRFIDTNSSHK